MCLRGTDWDIARGIKSQNWNCKYCNYKNKRRTGNSKLFAFTFLPIYLSHLQVMSVSQSRTGFCQLDLGTLSITYSAARTRAAIVQTANITAVQKQKKKRSDAQFLKQARFRVVLLWLLATNTSNWRLARMLVRAMLKQICDKKRKCIVVSWYIFTTAGVYNIVLLALLWSSFGKSSSWTCPTRCTASHKAVTRG